jgi:hypothetical protein
MGLKHFQNFAVIVLPVVAVVLLCHSIAPMAKIYKWQRVKHFKSGRPGEVIHWYAPPDKRAGKVWILFDDGEVELRWRKAFPELPWWEEIF